MRYPAGNCDNCGHRLYARYDDGYFCPNCWYDPATAADAAPVAADD